MLNYKQTDRPAITESKNMELYKAVHSAQHCQRNFDLSKKMPTEDIKTLVTAATQCPSKQNIAFYKLHIITNRDVIDEIYTYLENKANICINHGIDKSKIIIDPGFGFGKTLEHNYIILNNLKKFSELGYSVLSGISRKSMIGNVINKPPEERLYGSLAATVIAIKNLSTILRVHDVRETKMLLNFKNIILE